MQHKEFINYTLSWWTNYFGFITKLQKEGQIDSGSNTILYPNILLVSNCSGYYVAELIGATRMFIGLNVKKHKEKSIYRYLSQFDDTTPEPLVHLNSSMGGFRFLILAQESDLEEVAKRFPHINMYNTNLIRRGGHGSVFSFGPNFESCCIENCILINRLQNIYRCKNILSAYIVSSRISKTKLNDLYKNTTSQNNVKGIHTVNGAEAKNLVLAGQLQNLYLSQNLRETTIGEFIKLHPDLVCKAFKTINFVYEPYLKWIEHDGTCQDDAINPDLLIRRDDGFYDIYDLKTAALHKDNITKGGRKRRRFIDYVEEGIAQLANYREYFEYRSNAEYAKSKYNIEVNNPRLVLIVGNWENSSIEEVNQACRKYSNIEVIDYDTFCHLFIGTKNISS